MAVRPAQIWLPQAMINDPAYPQRLRRFFFFPSFKTSFVSFPLAPENIVSTVSPETYSKLKTDRILTEYLAFTLKKIL